MDGAKGSDDSVGAVLGAVGVSTHRVADRFDAVPRFYLNVQSYKVVINQGTLPRLTAALCWEGRKLFIRSEIRGLLYLFQRARILLWICIYTIDLFCSSSNPYCPLPSYCSDHLLFRFVYCSMPQTFYCSPPSYCSDFLLFQILLFWILIVQISYCSVLIVLYN
jgi:hypothetical protein